MIGPKSYIYRYRRQLLSASTMCYEQNSIRLIIIAFLARMQNLSMMSCEKLLVTKPTTKISDCKTNCGFSFQLLIV